MKKLLLALLFAPALATAAVQFDVTTRCAEDTARHSFQLNTAEKEASFKHAGVQAFISLESEDAESATFVLVLKKDERELSRSAIRAAFGEPSILKCASDSIDSEITIVVSQVIVEVSQDAPDA